jgi:hypothetical protein
VLSSFVLKSTAFYSRSQPEYPNFLSALPINDKLRERIAF